MDFLLEPFCYSFMRTAIIVSTLIGAVCAFLSVYLMLKGWSLIGDALSHSVVPGVAGAYMLGLPFGVGAFLSGGLAASTILFISGRCKLKQDTIIGVIYSFFFGLGLFMISVSPVPINVQTIVLGNILAISPTDTLQLLLIGGFSFTILAWKWKDFCMVFFDEYHAVSAGVSPRIMKVIFFTLLSASTVAALQTVGAFLVIAMVITPGATAYLISDRFDRVILLSLSIGSVTSFFGAYLSFFLDAPTGAIIVLFQIIVFAFSFFFAPKHGYLFKIKSSQITRETTAGSRSL